MVHPRAICVDEWRNQTARLLSGLPERLYKRKTIVDDQSNSFLDARETLWTSHIAPMRHRGFLAQFAWFFRCHCDLQVSSNQVSTKQWRLWWNPLKDNLNEKLDSRCQKTSDGTVGWRGIYVEWGLLGNRAWLRFYSRILEFMNHLFTKTPMNYSP